MDVRSVVRSGFRVLVRGRYRVTTYLIFKAW